jgi:hypothetical protein
MNTELREVAVEAAGRRELAGRPEPAGRRQPAVPPPPVVGPEAAVPQQVAAPRELAVGPEPEALPEPGAPQQPVEHREPAEPPWGRLAEHWAPAGELAAVERVARLALEAPWEPGAALWELAAVLRAAELWERADSLQAAAYLLARAKPGVVRPRAEPREGVQPAAPRPRPPRQSQALVAAPAASPEPRGRATAVWCCSGLSWLPFGFGESARNSPCKC